MYKDKFNVHRLDIGFDFDDTLTHRLWFEVADRLRHLHRLWLITARYESLEKEWKMKFPDEKFICTQANYNIEVYDMAKKLEIPNERIIFTNMGLKSSVMHQYEIDLLFDDDNINTNDLIINGKIGILV